MSFKPAISKPMKAVSHDQQLKTPPGSLNGIEAVGIIDLSAELTDDSLNDVGGARHRRMIEVGKEISHLLLKGEDLPLQPRGLERLPPVLPDFEPQAELFMGVDIEELGGQLHKGWDCLA